MDAIYVINRMYSAVYVFIVGSDQGIAWLTLQAGQTGRFLQCPPGDYAIGAFAIDDGSLQHLGKVRPGMGTYQLVPNQNTSSGSSRAQNIEHEITAIYASRKR
jgi:hypothetical protein